MSDHAAIQRVQGISLQLLARHVKVLLLDQRHHMVHNEAGVLHYCHFLLHTHTSSSSRYITHLTCTASAHQHVSDSISSIRHASNFITLKQELLGQYLNAVPVTKIGYQTLHTKHKTCTLFRHNNTKITSQHLPRPS